SDESAQGEKDRLWQVRTFSVDARIRQCAAVLQDFSLLAKLSKGDMIAIEAHYHCRCLATYSINQSKFFINKTIIIQHYNMECIKVQTYKGLLKGAAKRREKTLC
ncbi:MAG: hypothetical protein ACM31H_01515, partial [Nitrososphaerales archaeon]